MHLHSLLKLTYFLRWPSLLKLMQLQWTNRSRTRTQPHGCDAHVVLQTKTLKACTFLKRGKCLNKLNMTKKNTKNPRILISVNEDKMYNCKLFIQLGRKPALELSTIVKYSNGMLLWMDKTQPWVLIGCRFPLIARNSGTTLLKLSYLSTVCSYYPRIFFLSETCMWT